jgi:hypothetical protein
MAKANKIETVKLHSQVQLDTYNKLKELANGKRMVHGDIVDGFKQNVISALISKGAIRVDPRSERHIFLTNANVELLVRTPRASTLAKQAADAAA